jgi:hypothetical protein
VTSVAKVIWLSWLRVNGGVLILGISDAFCTVPVYPLASALSLGSTSGVHCLRISSAVCCLALASPLAANPPFNGTVFLSKDIITDTDTSVFERLEFKRSSDRKMFDRRVNGWIDNKAFLFDAVYSDGKRIEIQVNSEFGSQSAAQEVAEPYAVAFGRLPKCLRKDVRTSWIHKGRELFGGGNDNLLVHVAQGEEYLQQGLLDEVLFHEATHTSLDSSIASHAKWVAARKSDAKSISTYASDHPEREDLAETFLVWFALRHRPTSLSSEQVQLIEATIPARLAFLDSLNLDLSPTLSGRRRQKDADKSLVTSSTKEITTPAQGRESPPGTKVVSTPERRVKTKSDVVLDVIREGKKIGSTKIPAGREVLVIEEKDSRFNIAAGPLLSGWVNGDVLHLDQ